MTELELMKHAKNYLDQMAAGSDPLRGTPIPEGDLVLQPRISRCLAYVSGILEKVIQNGGQVSAYHTDLLPFAVTAEQLRRVPLSGEPIGIRDFCGRISEQIDASVMRRLNPSIVTGYLVRQGLLEEQVRQDGKKTRISSRRGREIGIQTVYKNTAYGERSAIVYDAAAQRYMLEHMEDIMAYAAERAAGPDAPSEQDGAMPRSREQ